jgi:hypothetical protein
VEPRVRARPARPPRRDCPRKDPDGNSQVSRRCSSSSSSPWSAGRLGRRDAIAGKPQTGEPEGQRREAWGGGKPPKREAGGAGKPEWKPEGQPEDVPTVGKDIGKGGGSGVDDLCGVAEQPRLGRDEVCKDPVVRCQDLPLHALGM